MKSFYKAIFGIMFAVVLSGCSTVREAEPEPAVYSEPRYDSAPIQLKVNRIDVVPEFTPSFMRPNVEHLFPVSIEKTAEFWAQDRLAAVDSRSNRVAEFIIKDASVVEEEEKAEQLFEKDRVKYKAVLAVILKITDPERQTMAETSVEAWRELMIPVDTPIEDKEKYWNEMVQKLFDSFNERMEHRINQSLNMYLQNNNILREYD